MNKWKMNRAGLLNFWYYDEETFTFADGKLLLRGSNGSGKSVTMQSFLPVLLDGRTSPDRLDPFGSKARRMEDYLLGEKEIVNRDERTGYLFLECKREETNQYVTVGIGLQAKRNKQMKFWGFVITDNRRIGEDIFLYKEENSAGKKQKIPLSRMELENRLADGGQVVQTKTEYMKLVNKYLFGFETTEAYEDLIKLLIQLRSPKLSKDFRPTVIYDILEAALPPLTDEDLRHLSDTIEQMDQTKQQIEQLDREVNALKSLNHVYDMYNQRILYDQASGYLSSNRKRKQEERQFEQQNEEQQRLQQDIDQLYADTQDLQIREETNRKQEERLRSHKVWNLEKERRSEADKLAQHQTAFNKKEDQWQDRRRKEQRLLSDQQKLEEQLHEREQMMEDSLMDLANDAEEAAFADTHAINQQDFVRHQKQRFDFQVWQKETDQHIHSLEEITEDLRTFDQLKRKYQDKDKELADENKLLDEASYQEQEWTRLFEEDKEKKLNEIHTWIQTNEWLEIPEELKQETARQLRSLYEPVIYDQLKEPYRTATFAFEQSKGKRLSQLNFEKEQLDHALNKKKEEIFEWKAKTDPEPWMDEQTKTARQALAAKGVTHLPLYAAIEFQEHVKPEVKRRIEAALIDSQLLDALITEDAISVTHDRILMPQPNMMAHTLADYVDPDVPDDSTISSQAVDDILRSIVMGDDASSSMSITETGGYQLGLLKGHAVEIEEVRYVGKNARARFREEQIARLEQEYQDLTAQQEVTIQAVREVKEAISQAKDALEQFPNDHDLQESFRQIQGLRFDITKHQSTVQKLSDELKQIHLEYSQIKHQLDQKTREYSLELSLQAYQTAVSVMKRYEKDLSGLEKTHLQFSHDHERLTEVKERLAEIEEEILEFQGELNVEEAQITTLKQNIAQIEQQLEQEGAQDIQQQIVEVQHELEELAKELKQKEKELTRKETETGHLNERLVESQKKLNFWKQLSNIWRVSLKEEAERGFVVKEAYEDMDMLAKQVTESYHSSGKDKDRSKLTSQLSQEYYKQLSDLMEYSMTSFVAPYHIPEWMNEIEEEDFKPHVERWHQTMSRQVIEMNFQGKQTTPYLVQEQIELEQARQESFLDEQDKSLYEEILFHSVGQKLRARIRRAEQWVNKMKDLMESRDTSSGLSFSIKWKPRTADTETELDTMDLVKLLRQDPKLLKEEDLDSITMHFRTKIQKAKDMMEGSNEMQTLLQVLKEVLDYRKWFSFVLYFQREGEQKRELNNNQFYKFSGGEKAMAMYIPLFTACYSRYLEADPEAPYIISLDEAFAGVDERNIRQMFEVVEQLGFNYIMNSQILWGDYDTVNKLAVSELIRPKNADYVSVLNYRWNGKSWHVENPVE
ncbi:TIGR02680 family protein [Gracilibacillus salinarum]|uniref:TIGR02680 family protein n=1 Tax=Gracilibacillus salinarum TaxID=2932255 RepID=A0ABY4GGV5_9BACI|nr:TIGR02680 family protein [Gracilibacillus salinarum]UOQ83563.1 TIGR02680 family protein [Gracilibacillus salinarum]